MATYAYTGFLTDLGENPFPDSDPELVVVANDAFGPKGLVAGARREVTVPIAPDGSFSVQLTASTDLSPSLPYTLRCTWYTTDANGKRILAGWAEWEFTALPGGGPIREMANSPVSVWFKGPPWPTVARPGFYHDLRTDYVWEWKI